MPTLLHEYSLDSAISYSFNAQPEAPAGLAKKPDFGWDAMFGSTEVCRSPSPPPRSGLIVPHKCIRGAKPREGEAPAEPERANYPV